VSQSSEAHAVNIGGGVIGGRHEKGCRHWGHDIIGRDTSVDAALIFTFAADKAEPCQGRDAVLQRRQNGPEYRLQPAVRTDLDTYWRRVKDTTPEQVH
tara:strand:- start:2237 stop:2530 length:294 start_codon:yes stop_codon:yes gene_type:complete